MALGGEVMASQQVSESLLSRMAKHPLQHQQVVAPPCSGPVIEQSQAVATFCDLIVK